MRLIKYTKIFIIAALITILTTEHLFAEFTRVLLPLIIKRSEYFLHCSGVDLQGWHGVAAGHPIKYLATPATTTVWTM